MMSSEPHDRDSAAPGHPTELALSEFSKHWLAGWNAHDPDALVALCHEAVIWDEPAPRRVLRGRDEVRTWLAENFVAIPDMHIEVIHEFVHPDATRTATCWKFTGTHKGVLQPPGFAPTGRQIATHGADLMTFRDGQLVHLRMIYDVSDMAVQLGLAPRPGGKTERALVKLQRTRARLRR